MENLPKDLINVIDEYSKDRSKYDEVIQHLDGISTTYENYWFLTFRRGTEFRSKIFWASDKLKKEYDERSKR